MYGSNAPLFFIFHKSCKLAGCDVAIDSWRQNLDENAAKGLLATCGGAASVAVREWRPAVGARRSGLALPHA